MKQKRLLICCLSCLALATTVAVTLGLSTDMVGIDAGSASNYSLAISSFTWRNTYFCYANTTNGNKLTFERESKYNDGKYGCFHNDTKIHYIKSITAIFSSTATIKVSWNNATRTSSYTDIPGPGWGNNGYYDEATITSGKKFTFTYGYVMYFSIFNSSNGNDLGLSRIVINYSCG